MEKETVKRPLKLDWDEVLGSSTVLPELVVMKNPVPMEDRGIVENAKSDVPLSKHSELSDRDLETKISKQKAAYETYGNSAPDKGEKFLLRIKDMENELQRRKTSKCHSVIKDMENELQRRKTSKCHSDCATQTAFADDLSTLGCGVQNKSLSGGGLSASKHIKPSSRELPFTPACTLSLKRRNNANGCQEDRSPIIHPGQKVEGIPMLENGNAGTCSATPSANSKNHKEKMVLLVDEDESLVTEEIDKICDITSLNTEKVYFPSRDDPESVEVSCSDIQCLVPQVFLTSPVINFYMRYLSIHALPEKSSSDFHFFSTFFFGKLKQAVAFKGNNRSSHFVKFRRWWKGVDIFQKAYIFIPIHENLHWSLVIICMPNSKVESGPFILHLDSLGLHSSQSIFENIRSYLREEWHYLNSEASYALPMPKITWKNLPRRIIEKVITVPQQKNEYDCGLFVLFFMEQFIKDAPKRFKKKDLAMFGRRWFKPEEASSLRARIRDILLRAFEDTNGMGSSTSPSSPQ